MHVFAPLLHCHELNLSRSLLLHTAVLCIESFLPWSFKLSLCRNHEKEDFAVQSAKFAPSHLCFKRQNFVLLPFSPISDFPSSLIADRPAKFAHVPSQGDHVLNLYSAFMFSHLTAGVPCFFLHLMLIFALPPCSPIADLPCSFTGRPCIESLLEQEVKTFQLILLFHPTPLNHSCL